MAGNPLVDALGQTARFAGRLVVHEKLTQQEIADRVGASRDMIGKLMKDLVAGGYLSVEDRTIEGPGGPIPLRVYRPSEQTPLPVLVFFHGGGFVICDLDTHDEACRILCNVAGVQVLSVYERPRGASRRDAGRP